MTDFRGNNTLVVVIASPADTDSVPIADGASLVVLGRVY